MSTGVVLSSSISFVCLPLVSDFISVALSAVHYGLSLGKNDRLTIFLINSVSWYHSKIIFT